MGRDGAQGRAVRRIWRVTEGRQNRGPQIGDDCTLSLKTDDLASLPFRGLAGASLEQSPGLCLLFEETSSVCRTLDEIDRHGLGNFSAVS
ncbi:UNVERIFIED_CONTAM: hypothetical protein K2H54_017868 [Gekko kuhli]